MKKPPTIAEVIMRFLASRVRGIVRLGFFKEIARRYHAVHLPIVRKGHDLYHRWRFPDGSVAEGEILSAKSPLGEQMLAF